VTTITGVVARDKRFPTSENLDGSDAMNQAPDYSAAYAILETDTDLEGHGLTFTIGRGNEMKPESLEVYEFPAGSTWTEKERSKV
jgi:L-fuconate dehydratase